VDRLQHWRSLRPVPAIVSVLPPYRQLFPELRTRRLISAGPNRKRALTQRERAGRG